MRSDQFKLTKSLKVVLVGVVVATGLAIGGVAINAGATSTTYYACLASAGTLSHVGTTKPTTTVCKASSKIISWNSQGAAGLQGPAGATGSTGAQGPQGSPGYTNYDLAQQNGFEGSLPQVVGVAGWTAGPDRSDWASGCHRPTRCDGTTRTGRSVGTTGIFGTNNNLSSTGGSAGAQCTLGDVQLTASSAIATNWVAAKGQTLAIASNTAMFSLMGTNYGGNGTTNFNLPNLTAAAPNGLTYIICVAGIFP